MSEARYYHKSTSIILESGAILPQIDICYHTWGRLNNAADNVIWVCHAFTANSDAEDWWPGMIGPGCLWDPAEYYIVCANILGSCYGTTGPLSNNPTTGEPWYLDFPSITVRDLVRLHELLRVHLGIKGIHTVVGGSVGAQQAMEWAIINPDLFRHLIIIAANARYLPWGVAFNEAQRMALTADPTFRMRSASAGENGLKAARSIAMLSYRNHTIYNNTQADEDLSATDNFRASSYLQYQGEKLVRRFHAHSYYILTKLLDTHNVGRGRGTVERALSLISARTLVIGIPSDILFPTEEQKFMAQHIPQSCYRELECLHGHDGFLVEIKPLTGLIRQFYLSA
jgi:homoserine O-acetyltransferase